MGVCVHEALLLRNGLELSQHDDLVGEVQLPGLLGLQPRVRLHALLEALQQGLAGEWRWGAAGPEGLLRAAEERHLEARELLQVQIPRVHDGGDDVRQARVLDGPPLAGSQGPPIGDTLLTTIADYVECGLLTPLHGLTLLVDVLALGGSSPLVRGLVPLHRSLGEGVDVDGPGASVPVADSLAAHHQSSNGLVQDPSLGAVEHVVAFADHADSDLRPLLLQGELQGGVEGRARVAHDEALVAVLAVAGATCLSKRPLEGQGVQEVAGGVLAEQLGLQLGRHAVVAVRSGGELHLRPLRGAHGESVATSDLVPSLLAQPECLVPDPLGAVLDLLPLGLLLFLQLTLLGSQGLLFRRGTDLRGSHGLLAVESRLQALGQVMGQLFHRRPLVLDLGQVAEARLSIELLDGAPARECGLTLDAIIGDLGEADEFVLDLG
mmetsp:Transcript_5076/g.12097  ORF Transcript_5076/g.12097 Transcript_5076/m.12097 type:complete len:436 (+) Transcript_5076:452-1759(+)